MKIHYSTTAAIEVPSHLFESLDDLGRFDFDPNRNCFTLDYDDFLETLSEEEDVHTPILDWLRDIFAILCHNRRPADLYFYLSTTNPQPLTNLCATTH